MPRAIGRDHPNLKIVVLYCRFVTPGIHNRNAANRRPCRLSIIIKILRSKISSLLATTPTFQPTFGDLLLTDNIFFASPYARGTLRGDPHLLHDGIDAEDAVLIIPKMQL